MLEVIIRDVKKIRMRILANKTCKW